MNNPLVLIGSGSSDDQDPSTPGKSPQEKRSLRLQLWRRVPATLQLLRLMAEEGAITSLRGALILDCPPQTARNALGMLVKRRHASATRGLVRCAPSTYAITPAGYAVVCDSAGIGGLGDDEDDEIERARVEQEAAERVVRAENNLARARHYVPRSVFDLGRCYRERAQA